MIPYNLSNESLAAVLDGETYTLKREDVNFKDACQALITEDWDALRKLMNPGKRLADWAQGLFTFEKNRLYFKGEEVPREIHDKFVAMAEAGDDPRAVTNFYQRLQNNPSFRSVQQLFRFLAQAKIPLDKDGYILAYKAVKKDYWDKHTGRTFRYLPGAVIEMPRNQISDDPNVACDPGLHVGARGYLGSDGSTGPADYGSNDIWLIVKIDPADVVSVPYDYNSAKMRVCRMEVVGHYGTDLPDTVWNEDDELEEEEEEVDDAPQRQPRSDWDDSDYGDEDLDEGAEADDDGGDDELEEEDEEVLAKAPLEPSPVVGGDLSSLTLYALRAHAKSVGVKNVKAVRGGRAALLALLEGRSSAPPVAEPRKSKQVVADAQALSADASIDELGNLSVNELRSYARKVLHIVGANKIPGGKPALLDRIAALRKSQGK